MARRLSRLCRAARRPPRCALLAFVLPRTRGARGAARRVGEGTDHRPAAAGGSPFALAAAAFAAYAFVPSGLHPSVNRDCQTRFAKRGSVMSVCSADRYRKDLRHRTRRIGAILPGCTGDEGYFRR
jgi:hypothetical protein